MNKLEDYHGFCWKNEKKNRNNAHVRKIYVIFVRE